jgi:hypothetical protein
MTVSAALAFSDAKAERKGCSSPDIQDLTAQATAAISGNPTATMKGAPFGVKPYNFRFKIT